MSLDRKTKPSAPLQRRGAVQPVAQSGWEAQERRVADALSGGQRVAGSGSGSAPARKSDVVAAICRVEAKTTRAKRLRVDRAWLAKISAEADSTRKMPAIALGFDSNSEQGREDWLSFRLSDATLLLQIADAVARGHFDEAKEWAARLPK